MSRRVNPASPAVVTVGMVNAGTAANIIPDRAMLEGTLRATDSATRSTLRDALRDMATHVAAAHGLEASVTMRMGVPPVVNGDDAARWAGAAAASLLGDECVVPLGTPNMAAEDFAFYLERIPGCFLRVGARRAGEPVIAAHSPQFDVAEECIAVGATVLAEAARRASTALREEHHG